MPPLWTTMSCGYSFQELQGVPQHAPHPRNGRSTHRSFGWFQTYGIVGKQPRFTLKKQLASQEWFQTKTVQTSLPKHATSCNQCNTWSLQSRGSNIEDHNCSDSERSGVKAAVSRNCSPGQGYNDTCWKLCKTSPRPFDISFWTVLDSRGSVFCFYPRPSRSLRRSGSESSQPFVSLGGSLQAAQSLPPPLPNSLGKGATSQKGIMSCDQGPDGTFSFSLQTMWTWDDLGTDQTNIVSVESPCCICR